MQLLKKIQWGFIFEAVAEFVGSFCWVGLILVMGVSVVVVSVSDNAPQAGGLLLLIVAIFMAGVNWAYNSQTSARLFDALRKSRTKKP